MSRLLFVCFPDTNHPIGGVKQIYRQVSLLHSLGITAFVLHKSPGFRVTWFESDAPVLDLQSYYDSEPNINTDIIVLPETWVPNIPTFFPGIKKVIFNQNAYYTFGLDGNFDYRLVHLYHHPDVVAVVVVSDDNRRLLVEGCGVKSRNIFLLLNGIDSDLFYPPTIKARRIVYLERKHVHHARAVAFMASQRSSLSAYSFHSLGRISHEVMARELRDSLVFLSCGHPEGFGLPLAEAIACGCIVVGYHGLSGRDFCSSALHSVEFGDLLGFVNTLDQVLHEFNQDIPSGAEKLLHHADLLLRRYSFEQEIIVSQQVWKTILSSSLVEC